MAIINNKKFQDDMKEYENNFFNTIFTDAPYQLGTEWYIDKIDGRPKVKGKSKDFMNKWDGLDENDLDLFFKESHRVVKYGGYLLIFGMDRQLLPLEYYARLNGFEQCQSLYWYFISNFPKSADLSKNIDKKLFNNWIKEQDIYKTKKQELKSKEFKKWLSEFRNSIDNPFNREYIGEYENFGRKNRNTNCGGDYTISEIRKPKKINKGTISLTQSNTELGQQFEGHKYSISPLKQTNETILVFRKAPNESILDDIINENDNCSPCCLNIDGCRVKSGNDYDITRKSRACKNSEGGIVKFQISKIENIPTINKGRFPPQTFLSELTAEIIDKQSGIRTSGARKSEYIRNGNNPNETYGKFNKINMDDCEKQEFGASKICHICDYEKGDYDIYNYDTKVSNEERNFGLDEFDDKDFKSDVPIPERKNRPFNEVKNTHPTLKPISLIKQIANYFKLPEKYNQKVYIPFCGTLSEVIGFRLAGYKSENIYGCELNKEYVDIGLARFKAYENIAIKEEKEKKRIKENNLLKWQ